MKRLTCRYKAPLTDIAGVVDEVDCPGIVLLDGLEAAPRHLHLVPLGHQVQDVDPLLVGPQWVHAQLYQCLRSLYLSLRQGFPKYSSNDASLIFAHVTHYSVTHLDSRDASLDGSVEEEAELGISVRVECVQVALDIAQQVFHLEVGRAPPLERFDGRVMRRSPL